MTLRELQGFARYRVAEREHADMLQANIALQIVRVATAPKAARKLKRKDFYVYKHGRPERKKPQTPEQMAAFLTALTEGMHLAYGSNSG